MSGKEKEVNSSSVIQDNVVSLPQFPDVSIKQVSHNVFDVFFGSIGWNDWARVRVDKRLNRVFHLKGKNVPNGLFKALNEVLVLPNRQRIVAV